VTPRLFRLFVLIPSFVLGSAAGFGGAALLAHLL
jgi:hypothetical protein